MSDASYEADEAIFRIGQRPVRRDLVDPPLPPATTDEPVLDTDEPMVSVQLDAIGTVARVTIESPYPRRDTR